MRAQSQKHEQPTFLSAAVLGAGALGLRGALAFDLAATGFLEEEMGFTFWSRPNRQSI
jgi:hypothetical protein